MGKIRTSDLFAETWIIFTSRYRAVLPIMFKAVLPYYAITLVMQFFNFQNLNMIGGLSVGFDGVSSNALNGMMLANLVVSVVSFLSVFYMFFVYVPATYGMNISILFPGVDGNAGLKHAFKSYGKALGNMLFSYLPALVATFALTIIMMIILVPIIIFAATNFAFNSGDGAIVLIIVSYIAIIFILLIGMSVAYAYSAQMIPLSLCENVPITKTFGLSRERGRGAILPYAAIMLLFYILNFVIIGVSVYLMFVDRESYFAVLCLSQVASFFTMPFLPSLNAATYRLCRNRSETGALEANNEPQRGFENDDHG